MSIRKTASTGRFPAPFLEPSAALTDLPRQQLATGLRAACAVLRGCEAMRRVQQNTAQQALAHYEAMADKLNEPRQPLDLLAIQAEILGFDMHGAAMYWQQLASIALEVQRELVASIPQPGPAPDGSAGTAQPQPPESPFRFNVKTARQEETADR